MNYSVTVLIATKNYSKYLSKAIQSALNQTYKPRCICVVNDCSDDDTWDILRGFAEQNQKEERSLSSNFGDINIKVGEIDGIDIAVLKLPISVGPSEARNVGIQFTYPGTDVYAILDGDDEMLPNKLEKCLEPFSDPIIGLTYANYNNINEDTGVSLLEVKEPFYVDRLNQECIVHSGFLVRKSYLDKVKDENGWYDKNMRTCEDWDLEIRLSNHCSFYHVPLALTNVLVHKNNSTNSVQQQVWNTNWERIRQKHFTGV